MRTGYKIRHVGVPDSSTCRYTTQDFKFTMGGDWFIIVHAKLPDGRLAERTFDLKGVAGGSNGN